MDSEFDKIDGIIGRFKSRQRRDLMPVLLAIQVEIGMITEEAVSKIGEAFKIPTSKVYGVASFFDELLFESRGKYSIKICNGTNCHLYHSAEIAGEIKKLLKIKTGETTRDGMFTLEEVNCLGGCDLSPVVLINDDSYVNVSTGKVKDILEYYITKADNNE